MAVKKSDIYSLSTNELEVKSVEKRGTTTYLAVVHDKVRDTDYEMREKTLQDLYTHVKYDIMGRQDLYNIILADTKYMLNTDVLTDTLKDMLKNQLKGTIKDIVQEMITDGIVQAARTCPLQQI